MAFDLMVRNPSQMVHRKYVIILLIKSITEITDHLLKISIFLI